MRHRHRADVLTRLIRLAALHRVDRRGAARAAGQRRDCRSCAERIERGRNTHSVYLLETFLVIEMRPPGRKRMQVIATVRRCRSIEQLFLDTLAPLKRWTEARPSPRGWESFRQPARRHTSYPVPKTALPAD